MLGPKLLWGSAVAVAAVAAVLAFFLYGRPGPNWHIVGSFGLLLAAGWGASVVVRYPPFAEGPGMRAPPVWRILGREIDLRALAGAVAPVAIVVGVTVWIIWPLVLSTPLSSDHPVHIYNAWHFWTEMLGRGRLRGWSHFWAFGLPACEFMPWGPDLWVALFRAATLGLLTWIRTYGIALVGMLILSTLALYRFTKRFFGTPAAVVAAILFILDPGGWAEGGWYWHTSVGVWPVTLGMSLVLLALVKVEDVIERGGRWNMVAGTLFVFASLITHLLPLIVYPVALPLLLLDHLLRRDGLAKGALGRVAMTIGLGFGLAAFQIVPAVVRSAVTRDLGVLGIPLEELARRLVELQVLEHFWPSITAMVMLGFFLALRHRPPGGIFVAASALVFVVLSSKILLSVFHAERLMQGILKIESRRMLLVAKLFWLALAGYAMTAGAHRSREVLNRLHDRSRAQRAIGLVLFAAIGAPLLKPAAQHLRETQLVRKIQTAQETPYWQDMVPFFEWSLGERQRTHEFFRIAYALPMHNHLSIIAPVFNQIPAYKVGYTPAQEFRSFPMTSEPELYEALCVKYVVTDQPLAQPDFVLDRTFGQLQVYRFARYRSQPFTLLGGGRAELARFEPERIELRLRGVTPGARLKLHVARYAPWEARLNGQVVPISPATVYGVEYPFLMEVPAADGDLVFRYVRRAPDWIGLAASLVSLSLMALLAIGRIDRLRAHRFYVVVAATLRKGAADRRARAAVSVLAVVLLGLVIRILTAPTRLPTESVFRLAVPPAGEISLGQQPCVATEPAVWQCGPHQIRAGVASGIYGAHFCLSAPAVGPLVFTTTTKLQSFIDGRYDATDATGRIRVSVDDSVLMEMATRHSDQGLQFIQIDTRSLVHKGETARLRIELEGGPLNCFDFNLVP